jgi:hypothetical protein
MKKILITIALLMAITANAQEKPTYKVVGNKIVKVEQPKAQATKTDLTYTIKDSTYQVYQTAKGGYYIIRISKKSGKQYKQYLPTN